MRTRAGGRSFAALAGLYIAARRAGNCSEGRIATVRHVLEILFAQLGAARVTDPRQITEGHLVECVSRLAERPGREGQRLAPASLALYFGVIRGFFAFLVARGFLLSDPARSLHVRASRRLPVVLTEAEARRLVNAPSRGDAFGQRDRAILEILYGSALRAGECFRLDVTDLDLADAVLFVRDGKGRKDRIVPLSGQAVQALDAYLRDARPELVRRANEPALFLSQYGRRLSRAPLFQLVKRHARRANIRKAVYPHLLRHTCATHLLQGGADVRHVQELLGHKKLETTALYTHVATADLKAVFRRCHPRERSASKRVKG